jgi:hypothetical protein
MKTAVPDFPFKRADFIIPEMAPQLRLDRNHIRAEIRAPP